jgi:capsular polysaccharide biosynthesis protein
VLLDPDLNVIFVDTLPEETILAFRRYVPRNCRRLTGTIAYLSNTWIDNYYHWMQLTLPLLRFYRELAPHTGIDYYYVGESRTSRLQEETLAQLGIRKSQIVREPCRADRLLTAIYLHRPQHREMRYRDVWGHRFVRSIFPRKDCPGSPKRIHIERGNVPMRRLANEKEVIAYLRQLEFVSLRMDGMTVASQARLFANATAIIGVHGAALTNLLFAQPGTKVIELFPPSAQEISTTTTCWVSRGIRIVSSMSGSISKSWQPCSGWLVCKAREYYIELNNASCIPMPCHGKESRRQKS